VFLRKKTILDNKTMRNLIRTTSVPIPPGLTQPDGLRVSRIGLPALNFMKVALYSALLLVAALAPHDLFADCLTVQSPGNKAVACDAPWDFDGPNVTGNPTNCPCELGGFVIFVLSTVTNGNCLQYNITRTWQVSNSCGETHTCIQTVSVINTNQPVFHGATNINLYSCGSTQVFFNVTATESCCGSLPVTCGPPSGYSFPPGPSMVGCSTMDCCGRTFNTTFYVYVHPLGVLAAYCPDKYVALGDTNWTFDPPIVSDDCCPGNYTFVPQTPVTNQASGPMVITEEWLVIDSCSQGAYCTETVYVTNTLPYSISWHKVAGGGGASPGGVYAVSGTAGQWDAGKLSGANLNLDGGFWLFAGANTLGPSVTKIAAGILHSLFVKSDGSLWVMGDNQSGDLGDGTTDGHNTPEQIVSSGVTAVAAGAFQSFFIKSDGSLWAMGNNQFGQLGDGTSTDRAIPVQIAPNNVTAIAAGFYHSLFLKSDGSLWAMGMNVSGQLGDGTTTGHASPVQVVSSGVTAIAAGYTHSLFLKSDGSLWAMGSDLHGELGDGTTTSSAVPKQIMSSGVSGIAAGYDYSFFLKSDGSLWAVGYNGVGQLGDGTTSDVPVPKEIVSIGVTAIATSGLSDSHSLLLQTDGSLLGMGFNAYGELGDGTTAASHIPKPIVCAGVTAIACGDAYSLFVKSDGSLWGMGYNGGGQLGDGTTTDHHTPEQIVGGLPGAPIPALLITSVARVGNDLLLSFASESCRTYNVLSTLDLAGGTWNVLQTGIAGNGGIVQVTIPNALVQPQQFFRIQQAQ
jgi:alpha-tubulin suppressor-like RCC1 family protein